MATQPDLTGSTEPSSGTPARARLLLGLPVSERRLEVDGVATSVLEAGAGEPLLLLHGGTQAGGLVWWRVIPTLAAAHRVVVPDLPGFGESASGGRPLDATTAARWLTALIPAIGAQRPTLVAHSAAGALAARLAAERGDLLSRLVLVDAGTLARFRPKPGVLFAAMRSTMRPTQRTLDGFMRQVMYDPDRVRADEAERWDAYRKYLLSRATSPVAKRAMRHLVRVGSQTVPAAGLARIGVPTTLLWGRHDRLIPLALAEAAAARHGWPLRVIDRAGHLPHVERPHAFLDGLHAT